MTPNAILALIETCFGALSEVCDHLVTSGVIPADHPAVVKVADAKQQVADAKAAATTEP